MKQRSTLPYLVLAFGVLMASTAALLSKGAIDLGVAPLTIAAGRLTLAALILTPIAWGQAGGEIRHVSRRDLLWAAGAGIFLALHFAAWISSLAFTSVASSTALVATNPVFVALASWLILRERLSLGTWIGVALTVCGSLFIALSDSGSGSGSNPLLGDGLAILGALAVACYFLVGRRLRMRLSLLPYIWLVYSASALTLLIWLGMVGQSLWGLPAGAYALLLGLAIGPQLLGHSSFNWAIKYLSATLVTVAILGEPISAAVLAVIIFDQSLQPLQILGGALLLAGIAVATLAEHRAQVVAE